MDASATPDRALPYTEHNVVALLNSRGGQLYRYFWVMLGDEASVTRALASTIIVALPYPDHRELFEIARTVCRQQNPAPAMPYARAEAPTLAAVTKAALRRLDPDDREICVLGAPAYRLNDDDLAAILGTWAVDELWHRAMDAFAIQLAACAAEAGLEQGPDVVERALRMFGAGQFALPYDEIVALATDPAAQWLREGIRARVEGPAQTAMARHGGMELLGTGSLSSVTVQGMEDAERLTVPLPRVPSKSGSHRRRNAVAGGVLAAGAIPVALAVAWAAHSGPGGVAAVPPLSAASGSPVHSAASSPAHRPAEPSNGYHGRHARPEPGGAAAGTTSAYMAADMTGTAPAPAPAPAAKTEPKTPPKTEPKTATEPRTPPKTPPKTATEPKTAPKTSAPHPAPTTTHGNGNGNGAANVNANGNGGLHANGGATSGGINHAYG